jgi:tetratricopeptide (TPR) repeat protein
MSDLIKGLIYVRDPLTLFALLSLVFLVAFKTRRVPELFFALAGKKLTREHFSSLLHRFMLYGFGGFVLVCGVAVVGNVLAYASRTRPYSVEDARKEIATSSVSEQQKQAAMKAYSEGLDAVKKEDFDQAIQSLQASLNAVPTLTAEYTLAYLYKKKGNLVDAGKHAAEALKLVKPGDPMMLVRAEQLAKSVSVEANSDNPPNTLGTTVKCQMIGGRKSPFPTPGKSLDDATKISPGLYIWNERLGGGDKRYFKMHLRSHETLTIDFRTPDLGTPTAGATIYDGNGDLKVAESDYIRPRSRLESIAWSPSNDGWVYFSVGHAHGVAPGTLYCVSVR